MDRVGRAKRQEQEPQPIRIFPHFVIANMSLLNRLQANTGPVISALNYFEKTLSVQRLGRKIYVPPAVKMCGPVLIPLEHFGTGVDTDFLYYVTSLNDGIIQLMQPCIT